MEPFGLLNFIKSAIQAAESTSKGKDEKSPTDRLEPPSPSTPQEKKEEKTPSNAFLSFCEQHEQRAKRLRK